MSFHQIRSRERANYETVITGVVSGLTGLQQSEYGRKKKEKEKQWPDWTNPTLTCLGPLDLNF